ncbi:retrovirus-related pol polyprotein from transposon TNT 1-94, partial [Tanacetum coccineum]
MNTQKTNVLVPTSTRVNCYTNASGSQPRSNTKTNRISPAKGVNKKKVELHPRINKSNLKTTNRVDSSSSSKRTIINSNSDSVCLTCNTCLISANHDVCMVDYLQSVKASPSIHNIYDVVHKLKQVWKPKQVRQVWKPIGKVLTSVGHQWRPTSRIFTLGEQCPLTRLTKLKVVSAKQTEHQAITCANQQKPSQNWGSNFPNSPSSSVFKCWHTDRSLCVFGALCYPTNDSEDLGKLQPTADIGIFVGYAPSRKGYKIYNKRTQRIMETIHVQFDELTEHMAHVQLSTGPAPTLLMPGQISLGLVPNPIPAAPYVPPTNKELEILFQPMFDEYLEPPRAKRPVSPAPVVLVPVNSAGTPSSTTIDTDAPSPSHSPSSSALQSPSLHQGVA